MRPLWWSLSVFLFFAFQKPSLPPPVNNSTWVLTWSDEFNGTAGTGADTSEWLYDIGTSYPGGPGQWGTGEVETMTNSTANVYQDGAGHLVIKPLHTGNSALAGWTSGRIETQRMFDAAANGALAIEASIQQPNVSGAAAAGYWPAFWTLGAPFRGNYWNWPGIGEIDVMEDINGRSSQFATLHCGTSPGGPCNEFTGLSSGERTCPGCQTGFHLYRVELDRSVSPQQIRWYLDGVNFFTVNSTQVDATTWANATGHAFFIILNVAMGGGFPNAFGGGPTSSTTSGVPMIVDYVRVYQQLPPTPPSIAAQPSTQTIASAQTATLSVTATGSAPLSYQWHSGPGGTLNPISGATASSYTTPAALATTSYWVRVSNAYGSVDSTAGTVWVVAPTAAAPRPASTGAAAFLIVRPTAATLDIGGRLILTADVFDTNRGVLSGAPVTWAVSPGNVVSLTGGSVLTLTGLRAGTAVLTATSGTATSAVTVTVQAP